MRDVRRLAKKDATAAIKLVAEVNAAAEKYAGKQVLTSRHSIFAELEKMQAAQASASMKATSPSTEQSSIFKPTEHTRHSKTGAELYSVKLADRVERAIFDDLKKGPKHMTAIIAVTPVVFYSTPLRMQKHSEPSRSAPTCRQHRPL